MLRIIKITRGFCKSLKEKKDDFLSGDKYVYAK
jgi:hypothetical protein